MSSCGFDCVCGRQIQSAPFHCRRVESVNIIESHHVVAHENNDALSIDDTGMSCTFARSDARCVAQAPCERVEIESPEIVEKDKLTISRGSCCASENIHCVIDSVCGV